MKKHVFALYLCLILGSAQAFAAFDEKGAPRKVHCSGTLLLAKAPIQGLADINDLLDGHTETPLADTNPSCAKYAGDHSGTCEAIVNEGKILLRYPFNTQNGSLTILDRVTGQSTEMFWTNQHGLTGSGYLTGGAWLTNVKGGLLGDPRAFQIEFDCQAFGSDWK